MAVIIRYNSLECFLLSKCSLGGILQVQHRDTIRLELIAKTWVFYGLLLRFGCWYEIFDVIPVEECSLLLGDRFISQLFACRGKLVSLYTY